MSRLLNVTIGLLSFAATFLYAADYVGQTNGAFRVDESGSATYQIPLSLPKGIAGVQPQLSFSYSSNGGDGYMGRGWAFNGASAITRCPKNMTQDDSQGNISYSDSDRLCLNGQRLVTWGRNSDKNTSDSDYWSASKYHTELDDFSIVKAHGYTSQGPQAFTVETKSGEIHYYGLVDAVTGNDSIGQTMALSLQSYANGSESSDDAFVAWGNNNVAKMWALKAIKDVKGNYIVYRYENNTLLGEHYLVGVDYTGRSGGAAPFASVNLEYIDNPKIAVGWSVGEQVSRTKLLANVTVRLDGSVYRYYDLNYFTSDVIEEKNYLETIVECTDTNKNNCLPTPSFTWQRPPAVVTSYTTELEPEIAGEPFSKYQWQKPTQTSFMPFSNAYYVKGSSYNKNYNQLIDFNGDGYTDIIYLKDNYWRVKFGPNYGSEEMLTTRGTGQKEFVQTIDYNGDGQRDLLVADNETSDWHILSYEKTTSYSVSYKCSLLDLDPIKQETADVCQPRTVTRSYRDTNTYKRADGLKGNAQVADVDGDGLEDIVFVKNGQLYVYLNLNGTGNFSNAQNIGNAGSSATEMMSIYISEKSAMQSASSVDINGDGRTDLIIKASGSSHCSIASSNLLTPELCISGGGHWVRDPSTRYILLVSNGSEYVQQQLLGYYDAVRAVDLNGDGYSDLFYRKDNKWYYRLSNGIEFLPAQNSPFTTSDSLEGLMYFIDLNADGRADVLYPSSSSIWQIYLSRPNSNANAIIFERRGSKTFDKDAAIRFGDMNADGKLDLLTSTSDNGWKTYFSARPNIKDNVITDFTSAWGVNTHVDYSNITDSNVYYRQESSYDINSDYFSPQSNFYVVSKVSTDTNNADTISVSYQYGGLLLHKKGRGLLGFEQLRTTDNQSGVVTETNYHQDWPYTGMPASTLQVKNDIILSSAVNQLNYKQTASGGLFPYIEQSSEVNNSVGSDEIQYGISKSLNAFTYDNYGNLTDSSVTLSDANNSNNKLVTHTSNTYGNSTLYQQKGRLTASSVTKTLYDNGQVSSSITRESAFTYYSGDLLLNTEVVAPGNALLQKTTKHVYDAAGNTIQISETAATTSAGSGVQTRNSYTDYDARYRYVSQTRNDLGESQQYQYNGQSADAVNGLINSIDIIDANGIHQRTNYNALGQTIQSSVQGSGTNDPEISSYVYQDYCADVSCGVTNAYVRTRKVADGQPEQQQFIDAWGREVASKVMLQDGSWSVTRKTYDSQGRMARSYEPGKGGASNYYNEVGYDAFGRVSSNRQANGGINSIEYYGNQTTTTNAKGQLQTTETDYTGQTVAVYDNINNVLTYQYNAFGQLLNVTAQNQAGQRSLRTSMGYDNYGHKISTNDQDKGEWQYQYNGFGELVSQTDAKAQTINFSYDRLGRKFRRYDASGTVCWDYGSTADKSINAVGLLKIMRFYEKQNQSCSTSATPSNRQINHYNSRGLLYQQDVLAAGATYSTVTTFDNYNRVYTQKYPANNFTIRHEYSNGHLIKRMNHYTGKVYQFITDVDGRGQATRIQYGNGTSEQRTYKDDTGFVSFIGLTSSAGSLHEFDYAFDSIGNLTHREVFFGVGSSANFNEYYDYDNLNRLTHRTIQSADYQPAQPCSSTTTTSSKSILLSYSMMKAISGPISEPEPTPGPLPPCPTSYSSNSLTTSGNSTSSGVPNLYAELPSRYRMNESYNYDNWGNITYKQYTGYYNYNSNKINRLDSVYQNANRGGARYYQFVYDNNGNVTSDGVRNFYYTNFDKPYRITQGASSTEFSYGANREVYQRIDTRDGKQTKTLYLGGYEKVTLPSGVIEHKFYVGNAVITERSNGANDEFYLHKDHQGSTTSITNATGGVVQQFIYDPWGKQYAVHSNSIFSAYSSPGISRGYTGHKMVNDMDIIHMNGRIYDPTLGRFLQADPHIQAPMNSQNYNRYSYVLNNPMSYTDPSGYFFKSLRRGIIKGATKIFGKKVVNLVGTVVSSVYGGAAGAAAWTYEFNRSMGVPPSGSLRAAAVAAVNTWANGPQSISTSSALQAMDVIDPETAKYLNFAMNGFNPDDWAGTASHALNEYKNHYVQEEVGRLARRNGMTGAELNALLTLGSFAGNKIAGSRYKGSKDGVELIAGMGRRRGGELTWVAGGYNLAGLPFDIIDIMLGYQGKLTASAHEYIEHGDRNNKVLGYSLGAMDLNNLASRGYAQNDSLAVSLPFLNFGLTRVVNGTHDPVNGGILGGIFTPTAEWENQGLDCHRSHCYNALGKFKGAL